MTILYDNFNSTQISFLNIEHNVLWFAKRYQDETECFNPEEAISAEAKAIEDAGGQLGIEHMLGIFKYIIKELYLYN